MIESEILILLTILLSKKHWYYL